MCFPNTAPSQAPRHTKSEAGFALIIALVLMAFMTLLLLSLSALVQTEISAGNSQHPQIKARQNALLGAYVALARLQEAAGPDQRSSAPLLLASGTHESKQHWIGVWHTDPAAPDYSYQPQLLVSGNANASDPITDSAETTTIAYVETRTTAADGSTGTVQEEVRVPLVPLVEDDSENYGYWIYDESLKIPLLKAQTHELTPWHITSRPALEQLADFAAHSPLELSFQQKMAQLPTSRSLPLLLGPSAGGKHPLHASAYTTYSRGVLANARDGGLRTELALWLNSSSAPSAGTSLLDKPGDAYPHAYPTWGQLRSFINLQDTVTPPADQPLTPALLQPSYEVHPRGDGHQGIHPILVAVQMGWGIHREASGNVLITMRPVVVLANPYNAPLQEEDYLVQRSFSSPASEYRTRISIAIATGTDVGTPNEIWVHKETKNLRFENIFQETGLHSEDREDAFIRLQMYNVSFAPGEVKVFTYASETPAAYASGGIALSNTYDRDASYIYADTGEKFPLNPGEEIRISTKQSNGFSHFALLIRDGSNWEPLQKIRSSHATLSLSPTSGSWDSMYTFKLVGEALDIHADLHSLKHSGWQWNTISSSSWSKDRNGIRFLADYNPRADRLIGEGHWQSSNVSSFLPAEGTNPLWISQGNDKDVFEINEDGSRAFWGPDSATESFVALFHLPRRPLVSLGELQHANLTSTGLQPAYAFGNALASPYTQADEKDLSYRLNQLLWDGYFFAARQANSTDSLNPRLLAADSARDAALRLARLQHAEQAAAELMVDAPFNVNNPSAEAWQALLSGLNQSAVQSIDAATGESIQLGPTGITLPRLPLPSGPDGALWRGLRTLSSDQIEKLSQAIATRVQQRGPFNSLADFVNRDLSASAGSEANLKGVLAAAIDAEAINAEADFSGNTGNVVNTGVNLPYPAAATGPRSTHAPGWLSQADILQAIGPLLTVRGDTFLIRSYGDVRDPSTNAVIARAWCELVVQRQPDYIAPDKNQPWDKGSSLTAPNDTLGRRFTIISFQWLDNAN